MYFFDLIVAIFVMNKLQNDKYIHYLYYVIVNLGLM